MRCRATNRTNGEPCGSRAVRGATVCRMHGAAAPAVKARAAERVAAEEAAKLARRRGIEPVENPLLALQQLAGEALAVKDELSELRDHDGANAGAYERAFAMAARLVTDMSRMALDERLARITDAQMERYVETLIDTLFRVLDRFDVDPHDQAVRAVIMTELEVTRRALSAPLDLRAAAVEG